MLPLLAKTTETSPSFKLYFILKFAYCLTLSDDFHLCCHSHDLIFIGYDDEVLRLQNIYTHIYIKSLLHHKLLYLFLPFYREMKTQHAPLLVPWGEQRAWI